MRGKRVNEVQSKQRRVATYENHCFSVCMGVRMPSLKINFLSCCLRLMLLQEHSVFQATDHDVIQRTRGRVGMFSYGKPTRAVSNTAEVLVETFPKPPHSLSDACIANCSDKEKWNTQHSKTDRGRMLCALFGPCRKV